VKTKLSIQVYGTLIMGINLQIKAMKRGILTRPLYELFHQGCPNTLIPPSMVDGNAKAGGMPSHTNAAKTRTQSNNLVISNSDEHMGIVSREYGLYTPSFLFNHTAKFAR
jgi:hypothetical protein